MKTTSILLIALIFACSQAMAEQADAPLSWQAGPTDVTLSDQATLRLPEGYRFLGPEETQAVLKSMGNFPSGSELGLIAPAKDEDWFVVVRYVDAGYVKDDDAANWNADELFASIKEGTEDDNKRREAQGIPPLVLIGWEEKPHYDAQAHKVVWAISSQGSQSAGVNYNTLALGRHGYMSMNMVGDLRDLPQLKPHVQTLLTNLNFTEGKRYADFNSATDKVAAVGLAALIAGAAFKSGILAKLWALLIPLIIAGKKLLIFLVLVVGGLLAKWLKKKPAPVPAATPPSP
ncbi:DUF2167 domain-containing protein [Nitrospira sp. KM1]|uniref:DUF2167 domain-containing protein n=1 Tax=Nitrospira sp. KM1 TaxID=1936990 RepID=UPI001566BCA1|nr:DUF2167 domain-containing protein [Nitrospira sp. KM1]